MRKIIPVIGLSILLFLTHFLKLSFVWGSQKLFFSGFCIVAPLMGAFFGGFWAGLILGLTSLLLSVGVGGLTCVTAGIPTLMAAWCWSLDQSRHGLNKHRLNKHRLSHLAKLAVNVVVPLSCITLFVFHPSVSYGSWYALYWFIPVAIYGIQLAGRLQTSPVATALKSTFIAHAIGSVMWCYLFPMPPDSWLALIPLVAIERLVFASGMVLFYYAGIAILSKFSSSIKFVRFLGCNFSILR